MKFTQTVTIEVNGKSVAATITLDAPGLTEAEDCINAQMILSAVASGQNVTYHSRHHKDRTAKVLVKPATVTAAPAKPTLTLVA